MTKPHPTEAARAAAAAAQAMLDRIASGQRNETVAAEDRIPEDWRANKIYKERH